MPGRNDPCPCGSGKKFKKCCLQKDKSNPIVPTPSPPKKPAPLPKVKATPPPKVKVHAPEPPPPDPLQEAFDRMWEDFESRDYEGQTALFLELLDDEEMMVDNTAVEMLSEIQQEAAMRGEWERFRELVMTLRERRPELYEQGAVTYLSWIISLILAAGQYDAVQPLALEIGRRASQDLDIFNMAFEELAYHGDYETLLEMHRQGWPGVRESEDILPWGISEFGERGVRYEIYHYVTNASDPDPNDPAFLERVQFYFEDPNTDYLTSVVDALAGRNLRSWSVKDFEMRSPKNKGRVRGEGEKQDRDPAVDNLWQLSLEFLAYLCQEEGVPFSRADMARAEIITYFAKRHRGDLNSQVSMLDRAMGRKPPRKPPKPEHPLCFERVTLDTHLGGMLDFLTAQHCRVAATFEITPAWLRFLQTKELIDEKQNQRTLEQITPLRDVLLKLWENLKEYTVLARAMQAWPEKPKSE